MAVPKCFISVLFLGLLPVTFAMLETLDYPLPYAQCLYKMWKKSNGIHQEVALSIYHQCYSNYRWKTSQLRNFAAKNVTEATIKYTGNLITSALNRVEHSRRMRRQGLDARRVRKEYRIMTDDERNRYHDVINRLKYEEKIDTESKYDVLASFHSGATQYTAHGGCNFLGFHRLYILMYEEALMQVDPEITLPYLDSTLDYNMGLENSANSMIWHDDFFGTKEGFVTSGPFANWNTTIGQLFRNVGISGRPMNDDEIKNITSRTRMHEICGDDATTFHDIEFIHGPFHLFVDGNMGIIEVASEEPVFWMHHAFVDYVWELQRENAKASGVDIETDYPELFGDVYHGPDENMGGELMEGLRVRDGLSEVYTKDIYKYAPRPTCSAEKPYCGSPYLLCVQNEKAEYKCRSMSIEEYDEYKSNGGGHTGITTTTTTTTTTTSTTTTSTTTTSTTTPQPTTTPVVCPTLGPPYPPPPKNKRGYLHKPIQNSFCVNGKKNINEWIYIPVRVTIRRPTDFGNYGSYPVVNGKPMTNTDIYSSKGYSNLNRYMRNGRKPADYGSCKSTYSGAGEIYIQTDGLNYDGTYKEFAIVDHRLAVSVSVAYVAIKNPGSGQSDVLISAYDSCGRVCRPSCLVPGTSNLYRPCAGALRVNTKQPLMFGDNFGESVLGVWDFNTEKSCPQFNINQIYVSFYCDYSDRWPWQSALNQPGVKGPEKPPAGVHINRQSMKPSPLQSVSSQLRLKPPANAPVPPKTTEVMPASPLKKCPLPNKGCTILKDDCNTPCEVGKYYQCVDSCDRFARCWAGFYFVQQCYKAHFDPKESKCKLGKGHCTDQEWNPRSPGKRRRKFGGVRGFGIGK